MFIDSLPFVDDFISLGLIDTNNVSLFNRGTRDDPSLDVYTDKTSGLIFIPSRDRVKSEFYIKSRDTRNIAKQDISASERRLRNLSMRINYAKEYLGDNTLLDFGCGHGDFLQYASDFVSYGCGIELGVTERQHLNDSGIPCFQSLDDVADFQFDIITMFHVLEHLEDPCTILRRLYSLLNDNGHLIIEVPNALDVLLSKYNCRSFIQSTLWSEHLVLYTEATLSSLLTSLGYHVEKVLYVQRFPLTNHLNWLTRGNPVGHTRPEFLDFVSEKLELEYDSSLVAAGLSDTLVIHASKL